MARYTGSVCKLCRREGQKLFLKGERCFKDKCAFDKRNYAPGQHGQRRSKLSEYGLQLREKQKLRRIYSVFEKQFRNYFKRAERMSGIAGENLLKLLEKRLDNIVYRMGFATSRNQARQLVRHGHMRVNNKKIDIPSYQVKVGDRIQIAEKSKDLEVIKNALEFSKRFEPPCWIEVDAQKLVGVIKDEPEREEIAIPIQEQLIVELYSK